MGDEGWHRPEDNRLAPPQPRLFSLSVLGEEGWLKVLKLEDYAARRARPASLQQALFPFHEAWG